MMKVCVVRGKEKENTGITDFWSKNKIRYIVFFTYKNIFFFAHNLLKNQNEFTMKFSFCSSSEF